MTSALTRRTVLAGGIASAVGLTLAACGGSSGSGSGDGVDGTSVKDGVTTITIGATPNPHVEMLQWIKDNLTKDSGIDLDIKEFTEYQTPNTALDEGSLAANFYQTPNFLKQQIEEKGYKFSAIADVHIEPMGIYSQKVTSLDAISEGATITINNDPANTARALQLLESAGLISLDPEVELPSDLDIKDNPKNIKISTVEGSQVASTMPDVDAVVLNGNYAIGAGLSPKDDALFLEKAEGSPHINQLVVRTQDKDDKALAKLAELMNSPEFKSFIEERWTDGSVLPVF